MQTSDYHILQTTSNYEIQYLKTIETFLLETLESFLKVIKCSSSIGGLGVAFFATGEVPVGS